MEKSLKLKEVKSEKKEIYNEKQLILFNKDFAKTNGRTPKYKKTARKPTDSLKRILATPDPAGRPLFNPITHIYSERFILFKASTLCGSHHSNGP